jgi:hypothetical protein
MKNCVLVKISKHQISFWYQIESGVLTPLSINGPNKIPLIFYVNGSDFKIGEFAKERLLVNDKNAYGDFFELVKDSKREFRIHGDSKPIKYLLYYGVEVYLSHFIKNILNRNELIEHYRTSFCLRFLFDDDIEVNDRSFVIDLFKEAGYDNLAELNSDYYLNREINAELKSLGKRLCLSVVANDMYVKLFEEKSNKHLAFFKLEQLGSDPRAKILAKLILEDVKEASPYIFVDEDREIPYIISHCVQLLSSLSPIIRNSIELSTGVKTDYKIRRAHLEERLMYNRGIEDKVIPKLEEVIVNHGFLVSSVQVVLIGDELNTSYFKDKLTKKFANVSGVDSSIEERLLADMITEIVQNNYSNSSTSKTITSTDTNFNNIEVTKTVQPKQNSTTIDKNETLFKTPPIAKTPPTLKVPTARSNNTEKSLSNLKEGNLNAMPNRAEPISIPRPKLPNELKTPPVIKTPPKIVTPPVLKVPPVPKTAKIPPPPPPPPPPKKN